jgi:hypothetical protein
VRIATIVTCACLLIGTNRGFTKEKSGRDAYAEFAGKPGPTGWRTHVIQPDSSDHGPDGINFHDWDKDGDIDVFVNYEEGKYSRLYFNPGREKLRQLWPEWIEFRHGKCEDSGIGDLDNDGDIDYIANGGWVYFNPGDADIRDAAKWTKMTVFDREQRVPTVADVDGDGLNDLIVGAQSWFKQPAAGKHEAKNWIQYTIGKVQWPMNCILDDVDGDGDIDLVVPDRRKEIFWFINPGKERVTEPWPRKQLHPHRSMFITLADVNGDGGKDILIAGGADRASKWTKKLTVLLRTNRTGEPTYKEIIIDQPCGDFPKGVKVLDLDGNPSTQEVVLTPKQGDLWMASFTGDAMEPTNWTAVALQTPGAETRTKMDNVYVADLDGDGDQDIVTTEENGAWGVVWFENPLK